MPLNKKISICYFINEIKYQIILISAFAVLIGLIDSHSIFKKVSLPLSIPTLIGTAVSILLAFRISKSYERWWEARTVWGAIVNDSRTLIRQLIEFMPIENENVIKEFAQRHIIWNYALGESLRRLPLSEKVQKYIDFYKINAVNIPNALLDAHSLQIKQFFNQGLVTELKQMQLNETISRLCDSMGKCERLKNTVFPQSYSILVHILIYLFTFILPFGLEDSQQFVEIAATIIIPSMFIAIEKTAIIMQNPFENSPVDTPMTSLAKAIEINIWQMIGNKDVSFE